jgi:mRNA interferase YafQ
MLKLEFTTKFKKDFKRIQKQGRALDKLKSAIQLLCDGNPLPDSMRDHILIGSYKGHHECHIEPDWLLIYHIDDENLILTAVRTGSHSELFDR